MHLLVVASQFPFPGNLLPGSFIKEQVNMVGQYIDRITVVCPAPYYPSFLNRLVRTRYSWKAEIPESLELDHPGNMVYFPRYYKLPGTRFLSSTVHQWMSRINQVISRFSETDPISIVHAHNGVVSGYAAIRVARKNKIPVIVTYHGSDINVTLGQRRKGWKLVSSCVHSADLNILVSHALKAELEHEIPAPPRTTVLYLGVDPERFFPAPQLTEAAKVIFVGRLERQKGIFDLLKAWSQVASTFPHARLTLAGPDLTEGQSAQVIADLGITQSVGLTGPLTSSAVAAELRQNRIFCLPSHGEGLPVAVMEAMFAGLPVIASRVGGISEIVQHQKNGFLVDQGDAQALARYMTELLTDRERCSIMRQASLELAHEKLDCRKNTQSLVRLYQSLLPEKN